jgi:ABC-type proline/glycine betaine transport system permease subunit
LTLGAERGVGDLAEVAVGKIGIWVHEINFFIVLPEIVASLGFGWVMNHLLHNNRLGAVVAGGVFMALAAIMMQRVLDPATESVWPRVGESEVRPRRL